MMLQLYPNSFSSLLPSWEACKDAICLGNTQINIYALKILAISAITAFSTAFLGCKSTVILGGMTLALALYLKTKGSKNTELEKEINSDSKSQKALFIKEYEDSKESLKTDITNKKIDTVTEKFVALSQKLLALDEPEIFKDSIRTTFKKLSYAQNMYIEHGKFNSKKNQTNSLDKFFSVANDLLSMIDQHVTNMKK